MKKITRTDAIAQGLGFYFTGEPCASDPVSFKQK